MNENQIFCQSCGMPLDPAAPELFGTEADRTPSAEYCKYCYAEGKFAADCTMEEMIEFCVPPMVQHNPAMTADAARDAMRKWFPTLKRWKKG